MRICISLIKSELDFVESVARKVLHEAEGYLQVSMSVIDSALFSFLYTGNKLILENPIEEFGSYKNVSNHLMLIGVKRTNSVCWRHGKIS